MIAAIAVIGLIFVKLLVIGEVIGASVLGFLLVILVWAVWIERKREVRRRRPESDAKQ